MSDVVIKAANLSKQYTLRHEGKERYVALRDVITRGAAKLGRRLVSPLTHNAPVAPDNRTEEFFALKDVSFEVKRGERPHRDLRQGGLRFDARVRMARLCYTLLGLRGE